MTYCIYVNNELEETDLTMDEALCMQSEILEESPATFIRIEPMEDEGDEEIEFVPDDEEYDEEEEEDEDDDEEE